MLWECSGAFWFCGLPGGDCLDPFLDLSVLVWSGLGLGGVTKKTGLAWKTERYDRVRQQN